MMKVSILLPVKNNAATLGELLHATEEQDYSGDVETVIVDSGSTDGSLDIARDHGVALHRIPPGEFHHGRTRNLLASLSRGERLVFLSADATPASSAWLSELIRETDAPSVAGAYSRQLPRPGASPIEAYFLGHLYGPVRRVQRHDGRDWLDMEHTLFSNVSSCIKRELWQRFPFDETTIMSEDQIWSRQVLLAGYDLVYSPAAAVYHSHDYSIAGAFKRFFDSGSSSLQSYMPPGPRGLARLAGHGGRYLGGEMAYLHRLDKDWLIPYALIYEAAKFAGLLAGRQRGRLPAALIRRMSYYGGHR